MGEPISESEFAALAFYAGDKSCCELVSRLGAGWRTCEMLQRDLIPGFIGNLMSSNWYLTPPYATPLQKP